MVAQQSTDVVNPRALALVSVDILRAGQSGDTDKAVSLALENLHHAISLPRLAQICLQVLMRAERTAEATRLVEDVVRENMTTPEVAILAIKHLVSINRASEAWVLATKAIEAAPKPDTRLSEAAARAALAAYRPLPEVFAFLERAKAGGDKDGIFLRAYGEICLSLGRYGEAEDVLKKTVAMAPNVVKTRLLYARALKHLGRIDEACDQMSIIVDQEPSPANKRLAVGTLLRAGRDEEAGRLYHAMVDERKAKLQGSFGEVVQAIDARIDTVKIPQGRLDWAWDLATRTLGSAPSDDRAEWDRRAKWGHLLDTAIIDWLECSTERAGEVAETFSIEQRSADILLKASGEGKGVLLASAHVGQMFAGPIAIHGLGRPYRWLSSTPRVATTKFSDTLISTADLTETQVARHVFEALQKGCLIAIAVDGAMSPNTPRIQWEGVPVTYSPFCALMAYKFKIPTIFTSPFWKDGRIQFTVTRLPDADEGEELEQFTERWRDAFFKEVKRILTRGPESLRLNGGLWRHIN